MITLLKSIYAVLIRKSPDVLSCNYYKSVTGKVLRIIFCRICIIQYTKNVLYNVQKMYSTMNHNGTGKITFKNSSQISVKLSTFSR